MKKFILIIAIVSLLLNVVLIYLFVIKGNTTTSNDERTAINMSEVNKDFVLAEMREFLKSVQQINEGILENNPEKIIKAGNKSGGSVIEHAPQGLLKTLPISFKSLGFSTHDMFDEIAESAKTNFDKTTAQKQLNLLLYNCVACHQAYKINVIKND